MGWLVIRPVDSGEPETTVTARPKILRHGFAHFQIPLAKRLPMRRALRLSLRAGVLLPEWAISNITNKTVSIPIVVSPDGPHLSTPIGRCSKSRTVYSDNGHHRYTFALQWVCCGIRAINARYRACRTQQWVSLAVVGLPYKPVTAVTVGPSVLNIQVGSDSALRRSCVAVPHQPINLSLRIHFAFATWLQRLQCAFPLQRLRTCAFV